MCNAFPWVHAQEMAIRLLASREGVKEAKMKATNETFIATAAHMFVAIDWVETGRANK